MPEEEVPLRVSLGMQLLGLKAAEFEILLNYLARKLHCDIDAFFFFDGLTYLLSCLNGLPFLLSPSYGLNDCRSLACLELLLLLHLSQL